MYSNTQIQRLQSHFPQVLKTEADHIVVENSQNTIVDKIREYVKKAGFYPIVSANKVDGNFVFTVIPYSIPDSFKFAIPSTEMWYKDNNQATKDLAFKNPDAYKSHFKNNKNSILECATGLKGNALILALGNGDDIPLKRLAEQFDQVDAVDIDMHAMQQALQKIPPLLQKKVNLIKRDLSGLMPYFSKKITELDLNISEDQCLAKVAQLFESSLENAQSVSFSQKYNLVVSSMLTSQLFANLQTYLLDILEKEHPKIKVNQMQATTFNDAGRKVAKFLCLKHFQLLKESTLPEGRIYYADTVKVDCTVFKSGTVIRQNVGNTLPNGDIDLNIKENFDQVGLTVGWEWETKRMDLTEAGNIMSVMAVYLQPKV